MNTTETITITGTPDEPQTLLPSEQVPPTVTERHVQKIMSLLAAYKIPIAPGDEASLRAYFQNDPEMAAESVQFFIGFIEFRKSNPVVLITRYQEFLMAIISKTNYLLSLGMINPYFLIEIPQHNAVDIETIRPKIEKQVSELSVGAVRRLKNEQAVMTSDELPKKTVEATPEELQEQRQIRYLLSLVDSFNTWIKRNHELVLENLSAAFSGKPAAEIEELINKLQIRFVDKDQFFYGLDAINESGQTYRELMFSKLLLGLEASHSTDSDPTEFNNLLRIRNYAQNPELFVLTFLLSLGVSESVYRKAMNISSESYVKMRDTISQYMGHITTNKGSSVVTISMALGRECSAYSEWNPFMDQAVAALDYCYFYQFLRANSLLVKIESHSDPEAALTEAFRKFKETARNQQSRQVSDLVLTLAKEYLGDNRLQTTLALVTELYKDRSSHNGFGTRMLKMRARKKNTSLSTAGKVLSNLLGVEEQIIGGGYVFIPEGLLMWFGAALEQAKK